MSIHFFRVIQSLVYLLWEKCHSNLIFVLVSVTYKEKLQKIKIKKKFTFRKITSTTKFSFLRLFDDALNTLLSYLGKTILYLGITYLLRIAQCTSLDIHIEKNNSILLLLVIEKLYQKNSLFSFIFFLVGEKPTKHLYILIFDSCYGLCFDQKILNNNIRLHSSPLLTTSKSILLTRTSVM